MHYGIEKEDTDSLIAFKQNIYEQTVRENVEFKKQIEQLENKVKQLESDNEDLQKSVEQIYDDYQDIGKMFFDLDEKVEAVKVICRQKYSNPVIADMTNTIINMLGGNKNENNDKSTNAR